MTHILNEDVKSNFKNNYYGKKATLVNMISQNGNVAIVEDKLLNRFPVTMDKITVIKKI